MHLILFDIDGTLIRTHEMEADCFIKALTEVTGLTQISRELTDYEHVTDTGIARECIRRHLKRDATLHELSEIERTFLVYFKQALTTSPFISIPGASQMLHTLKNHAAFKLAIATGSYHHSALLKLQFIAPQLSLPIATANDSIIRTDIMKTAVNKAKQHYAVQHFQSITYIGDGPWDIAAVNALQWDFIGIASHHTPEKLREWGAKRIFEDYLGKDKFLHSLVLG